MALKAICAKISTPIFSIKHPEVFQIAASLPIPQPSTLTGALAYCIGVHSRMGLKAKDEVERMLVLARAKILNEVAVVTPIMLRRFRVLDKGFETKRKGEIPAYKRACDALSSGDFDYYRRVIEVELTDALYREYVTAATIKCVWILREPLDHKLLYLLQRLGDTESLVTVMEAWSADCSVKEVDSLRTEYPMVLDPDALTSIGGDYTVVKMCDEHRILRTFCIPCKKDVLSTPDGVKYFAYVPTSIEAEFKKPVEVFTVDGEDLLGYEGGA